ncbi:MAG: hypothetical protein AB1762_10520 [Gemmatimonadota bacterium]
MIRTPSNKRMNRRGSALMLVLLFTLALGGLAISAIYMNGTTTVVSKLYERERDYRYAAEWALAMGKSQISKDTTLILPDSLYIPLMTNVKPTTVGGQPIPLVRVDLYAGLSGVTSGQYGRAVSLVAVASDSSGARHVRRLELLAENFAVYAVFVDNWQAGLCYTTGEIIRGRAHSNTNWVSCSSSPGPIYTDSVSAVTTITGTAQYQKGNFPNFVRINYPTNAWLNKMINLATGAGYNITPVATATRGGSRMEFVAIDLNGDGDVTDMTEGFFRIFDGNVGALGLPAGADTFITKSQLPNTTAITTILASAAASDTKYKYVINNQCGATYTFRSALGVNHNWFIPISAHNTASLWFRDSMDVSFQRQGQPAATALANANAIRTQTPTQILTRAGARCYTAGDPHLMVTERFASPDLARWGGEDSTFTANGRSGSWRPYPNGAIGIPIGPTRQAGELPYLWPLHRALNPNFQGVIYIGGDVFMSGLVRGRATVFAQDEVKFVDDVTYTSPPGTLSNICTNLLGILTGNHASLTSNAINRPKFINSTAGGTARFLDDNQDFFLHGVTMSGVYDVNGGFYTELYNQGGHANRTCTPQVGFTAGTSGGCINQAGGVIQRKIYATFSGGYTGFAENRVKDPCLDFDSPPFFPLTGRYKDNEFYEIDPQQFLQLGVLNFYRKLQGI